MALCLHDECALGTKPYSGRGPRSVFCLEHSKAKYRKARSRAGIDLRPECCRNQGPRGRCIQHEPVRAKKYDLDPDSILGPDDNATAEQYAAAQISDAFGSGLRITSPWRAAAGGGLTFSREQYHVIGQSDLDEHWREFKANWQDEVPDLRFSRSGLKPVTNSLIRRGPDWPFADVLEANRAGELNYLPMSK